MEWIGSLKLAIDYMEKHLLENISSDEVADAVYMSPFYFQKGFKIMTGYSVGEYIRCRRLYMAALDVISDKEKVIDLAYKYGYDTPESFTKAFSRFHGVSPKQMKGDAKKIKTFLPLKISVSVKGGNGMDYVIEKMDAMKVIGYERDFSYETAYKEIPKFWNEFSSKYCTNEKGNEEVQKVIEACMIGEFGICIEDNSKKKEFQYMIAGRYNGSSVPVGMKIFEIPAVEWAKFKCTGPLPGSLQSVNTQIFKEWLPGNLDYEIAMGMNIEWYSNGDCSSSDYKSEIWIPVKKK
jgi:AraC family transcriptional regulator